MKKQQPKTGLILVGRFPKLGVTNYFRNGEVISRPSESNGKRSNTRKQFIQRQRMRHTMALWKILAPCNPMFTGGKTTYLGFISLANRMPAVYIPKRGSMSGASFLMPDMPVSDGTLQPIKQHLGEVNGTAALITNLKADTLQDGEKLMLYTAEQQLYGKFPMAGFKVREVALSEFTEVNSCLALVNNDFADDMKGWALVRVNGERCSSQGIVTRCNYYEQFTTEEAFQEAVKSYGGLK